MNKFKGNTYIPKARQLVAPVPGGQVRIKDPAAESYPGDQFRIQDRNDFEKFKTEVEGYLKKYPDANLVTLRGRLNQDKRYAWQDISKAVGELMEERRFTPDNFQYSQLPVINQAPLPGMVEQFNEWLKETK